MKRIEAVVRQETVSDVKAALEGVPHIGLRVCETDEHDGQEGTMLRYRGSSYLSDSTQRACVCVLVDDADSSAAVDAIAGAARTGHDEDGFICVVPCDEVVEISGQPVAT